MSGEQRIDEKRLAEIEARASAATSGPWLDCGPDIENRGAQSVVLCDAYGARGVLRAEDSAFISAARTDVPALVADLRAARAENEGLTRALNNRDEQIHVLAKPIDAWLKLPAEKIEYQIGIVEAMADVAIMSPKAEADAFRASMRTFAEMLKALRAARGGAS